MISGLVLKYLNGECFVIYGCYKYTLLASTEFNLTVPLEVLSSFVKKRGFLATQEARLFVSGRILGQKKKRGNKRTRQNTANDVILLGEIIDLRKKHQCSEYQAIRHYMAKLPEPKNHREMTSIEIIRSAIKRAKLFFTEHMGRPPY